MLWKFDGLCLHFHHPCAILFIRICWAYGIPLDGATVWDDLYTLQGYGNPAAHAAAGYLRDGHTADIEVFRAVVRITFVMLSYRVRARL